MVRLLERKVGSESTIKFAQLQLFRLASNLPEYLPSLLPPRSP